MSHDSCVDGGFHSTSFVPGAHVVAVSEGGAGGIVLRTRMSWHGFHSCQPSPSGKRVCLMQHQRQFRQGHDDLSTTLAVVDVDSGATAFCLQAGGYAPCSTGQIAGGVEAEASACIGDTLVRIYRVQTGTLEACTF